QDVRAIGEERAPRLDDLDAASVGGSCRHGSERGDECRGGDHEETCAAHHRRRSATFVVTGRCPKRFAGSSMPRLANLSRKIGRSPVDWSFPLIVPSGAKESILNSKMSCIVITSDSMRWTSVMAVQ